MAASRSFLVFALIVLIGTAVRSEASSDLKDVKDSQQKVRKSANTAQLTWGTAPPKEKEAPPKMSMWQRETMKSQRLSELFDFSGTVSSWLGYSSASSSLGSENAVPEETESGGETFLAWATLLLLCVEMISFLTAYVLKQTHFEYLQEAGAVIFFGGIVGGFVRLVSSATVLQEVLRFDAEFFLLFLLPPIIFESGYTMQRRRFFKNIDSVLAYAFVGTTVATFATGGLMYMFVVLFQLPHQLTLLECLLFGALISSTDPVTVLAIFKELKVDYDLYSNVFGESVLNDAIAIVLFRTLMGFVTTELTVTSLFAGVGMFLLIFCGSTFIGLAIALTGALVFKHTHLAKFPNLEAALVALLAYSSYLISEGLHLSGIVAILFCGIGMAHYMVPNLSKDAQHTTVHLFEIAALISETLVFVYLGLSLFSIPAVEYEFGFIFLSLFAILASRAFNIFPLTWLVNLYRKPKRRITFRYQFFCWFAGLRGAIAFALALMLPAGLAGKLIFTTTMMIVFFTVLVLGGVTIPLLKFLEIPMGVGPEDEDQSVDAVARRAAQRAREEQRSLFLRWDRRFLRPFFVKEEALVSGHLLRVDDANVELHETGFDDLEHHMVSLDLSDSD